MSEANIGVLSFLIAKPFRGSAKAKANLADRRWAKGPNHGHA